jgi:signal transduction histidine kinase
MVAEPYILERAVDAAEAREYAMHCLALACGAGGMAHQVRNPLNAMALQLALVAEKIGSSQDLAGSCADNLAKLLQQIERIDGAVRAYLEVARPEATAESEARRRRVALVFAPVPAPVSIRADGARVRRVWAGSVWRALAETAEGGAVVLGASSASGQALLSIAHPEGPPRAPLAWIGEATGEAAEALGGRLEESVQEGMVRLLLRLPGEGA